MRSLRLPPALPLLLLLIGRAATAHAAVCAGTDAAPLLCPDGTGPCVVSTSCSLPSDGVIDLGARRLVIQGSRTLTIPAPGKVSIKANGIELQSGAKIVAEGAGTPNVTLRSTSTTAGIGMGIDSRIVAGSAGDGGSIDLTSDGPVVMSGQLRALGQGSLYVGGSVSILAQGDVSLGGTGSGIFASGGLDGFGGTVDITTIGRVTVSSDIKIDGGDGGSFSIDATGDVEAGGSIDADATLGGGYGGDIDISGRDVRVFATVQGTGKREDDGSNEPTYSGGDGAAVAITATGNLLLDGTFDIKGGPGGAGGDFELDAVGDITLLGKVLARAEGKFGSGSESISIWSDSGNVTVGATIDAAGGSTGGGIDVASFSPNGSVRLTGTANLSAAALDGLPANEQLGGSIDLDACAVEIQPGAVLTTAGLQGVNTVRARSSMVIAGTLKAGLANRFEYRDQAGIINILGQVVPAATQVANPALSCCGAACVPPSTTTTSLPSATSTTSAPSTTTTSLPPPTTTTSLPDSTTTTTSAPATSSTSTTSTTSSTSPPATSSTTSTTSAPPTSSTVVATSTTVASPTSTSISLPPATTTTTQPAAPASCATEGTEFGAVDCTVGLLTARVNTASVDQLGGKATANRLRFFLRRAARFLDNARAGKDSVTNLRRAQRELKSFERVVQQGIRRKRRPIDAEVGGGILSLSTASRSEIGILQAGS